MEPYFIPTMQRYIRNENYKLFWGRSPTQKYTYKSKPMHLTLPIPLPYSTLSDHHTSTLPPYMDRSRIIRALSRRPPSHAHYHSRPLPGSARHAVLSMPRHGPWRGARSRTRVPRAGRVTWHVPPAACESARHDTSWRRA